MNNALKTAVIRQIGGKENAETYFPDVCSHGAEGGFIGFTYYADTIKFWRKYKRLILKHAEELANDLGEDMLSMIQNFNAIEGEYTQTEIGRALFGGETMDKYTSIYNIMSWFALEEVARDYCDKKGI